MEKAKAFFGSLPAVALSDDNISTGKKVLPGKTLYFDVGLSKDNTQSCNTCHNLETFGVDNQPTSPGNNGELGNRNSPTVLTLSLDLFDIHQSVALVKIDVSGYYRGNS